MPAPRTGIGPWGRAIQYWLQRKNMNQADLIRASGVKKNAVSAAVRGLPVHTRTLAKLAAALQEPLEHVLVSPEWIEQQTQTRAVIVEAVDEALRQHRLRHIPTRPTFEEIAEASAQEIERTTLERKTPKKKRPRP